MRAIVLVCWLLGALRLATAAENWNWNWCAQLAARSLTRADCMLTGLLAATSSITPPLGVKLTFTAQIHLSACRGTKGTEAATNLPIVSRTFEAQ